jgi:hypothetical protein
VGKRALDSGLVTLQGNNGSGRGATSSAAGGGGDGGGDISVGVSGGGGGGGHGGEKSLAACLSSLQQRVGRLEPETVVKARKELAPLQKALEQVHVCFFFSSCVGLIYFLFFVSCGKGCLHKLIWDLNTKKHYFNLERFLLSRSGRLVLQAAPTLAAVQQPQLRRKPSSSGPWRLMTSALTCQHW